MDIDQDGRILTEPDRQIILPKDVLPNVVHLVPQENRPVFPGQVFPVILDGHAWGARRCRSKPCACTDARRASGSRGDSVT
jgi:hypothetical protein